MHADGPGSGMVPLGPNESYAVRTGTPGWQRDKPQHLSTSLRTSAEAKPRLEMGAGRMNSQPGFAYQAILLTEYPVSGLGRSSARVCLRYFSIAGIKHQVHGNLRKSLFGLTVSQRWSPPSAPYSLHPGHIYTRTEEEKPGAHKSVTCSNTLTRSSHPAVSILG